MLLPAFDHLLLFISGEYSHRVTAAVWFPRLPLKGRQSGSSHQSSHPFVLGCLGEQICAYWVGLSDSMISVCFSCNDFSKVAEAISMCMKTGCVYIVAGWDSLGYLFLGSCPPCFLKTESFTGTLLRVGSLVSDYQRSTCLSPVLWFHAWATIREFWGSNSSSCAQLQVRYRLKHCLRSHS